MSTKEIRPIREWLIGSDPSCQVVLTRPDISPRHCLLAEYPQGFALEDLGSSTGTWLNGQRLQPRRPQRVTPADEVRLGPFTLMPWPKETSAESSSGEQPGLRTVRIGRGAENEVVLDYPMISWNHAVLTQDRSGNLTLEDLNSTNGTFLAQPDHRIQRAAVRQDDDVFFGSLKVPVSRLLSLEKLALGGSPHDTVLITSQEMIIGRDPECGFPVDSPVVSWHHAKLLKSPRGIEIEDLDSRNGTFVDGVRIAKRVRLQVGNEVALGSARFRLLDESGRLEHRDYRGNVTIEAAGITVEIRKGGAARRLLDPVSLTVFPSELVALMGLAGAGKTTLMKALNGYTPPSDGHVLFNGEDLYANQEQFRLQIGYVPQDDILHPQLTVREALYYTAKLRTDLRPQEINARIDQVLKSLGIEDTGDRLIGSPERKVISGGQRKRVNIAMELLSDPSVLFLDEPTSGLSSFDALQVVNLLSKLAQSGKTIICTIHQPSLEIFKEFTSLIMVAREKGEKAGVLAYFGPAYPGSIEFFNPGTGGAAALSPEQLMSGVAAKPASEWSTAYQNSEVRKHFVESRAGRVVTAPAGSAPSNQRRELGIGQAITLFRRNVLLKLRDRTQTLILLAQAPLFGILVGIVFKGLSDRNFTNPSEWAGFMSKVGSAHFLTVVAAVWFGCNNAARDIVGETAIFLRERMVNLKLPSYVFSKLATLGFICLFQCLTLLGIVYVMCDFAGPFLLLLSILFTAALVGSALGLVISSLAPTTESAIAFLPVVLLPFILLAGGIKPVHEMPREIQWIAAVCPTRWAYEANLLQEAKKRQSTFKNALEEQLVACRSSAAACGPRTTQAAAVAAPAVKVESDIAATAFPVSEGRSGLRRSFEVLGVTLTVCLTFLLSSLALKRQN